MTGLTPAGRRRRRQHARHGSNCLCQRSPAPSASSPPTGMPPGSGTSAAPGLAFGWPRRTPVC